MAIGVFDSGLGGLTVVRQLREKYPGERIVYYGDTARVPYGEKKPEDLIRFADRITGFLIDEGARLVIDACNTTSALAIDFLVKKYGSEAEILGVVNSGAGQAARVTGKKVALMATEATVSSGVYQQRILARNNGIQVYTKACPRLVPFIENGDTGSYMVREALEAYIEPLVEDGIDALIMGCTHYPFLLPLIREIVGEGVELIDPAREVTAEISGYTGGDYGPSVCYTSAGAETFRDNCAALLPEHGFTRFVHRDIMAEEKKEKVDYEKRSAI